MSLGGFTLADRLGAKTKPCSVRGCSRTWLEWSGKAAGLGRAKGADAEAGLCDPCRKKKAALADKERRCDVAGCDGKWTWPAAAQLEAFAAHKQPPKGLCASCESKLAALEDKEVACAVPGCSRTATLTRKAQLLAQNQAERAAAQAAELPTAEVAAIEAAPEATTETAEATTETAEATTAEGAETAAEPAATATGAAEGTSEPAEAVAPEDPAVAADGAGSDNGAPAEAARAKAPEQNGAGTGHAGEKSDKADKPGRVTYEGPLCGPCHDVARRLTDRAVSCGINGCKRKWIWKADEQIQAFAAGKPNEPPRRMCETCRASFGKLLDREVRCRTSGCKKTWTWSRFDQLDACQADKGPPKAPSRMCESCFQLFQTLKDVERPCRKPGCKRTWTDKRGAQLARAVRGRTGDPFPQYCVPCQKELGDLEDREIRCKTEGCTGTWTWTREMQLKAGVHPTPKVQPELTAAETAAGAPATEPTAADAASPTPELGAGSEAAPGVDGSEAVASDGSEATAATGTSAASTPAASEQAASPAAAAAPTVEKAEKGGGRRNKKRRKQKAISPPDRLCHACAEFLKEKKTLEIPCSQCGTPIFWPPESQLQSHLGNWATPSLCGACKRDATEAARLAAKEILRQQAMEHAAHPEPPPAPPEETAGS